ncbi:methyl-accepting chemotaxis protein [Novosphingobium sp. SG720]|uniref:methyl-accepting chemotaxis protein n=1 Tax=Novosphingobium sp. SG720 TaxID=2586998 RepID=UPI00144615CA|nr:methyl-accepting chemotaxis protein [Novosphingobium sp. SG720]NKJ41013.1 methyl-accepting chemotaxis protein [Novosphingobium sp. SG720]
MAWASGLAGRLEDKSIDARLNIQARAAVISAVVVFATIITSSLFALDRQRQAHIYSQQAVRAAMLEKDFTSLARDVFRHAAINTADSRKDVDGNIGDMKDSMAAAKAELDDSEDAVVDQVGQKFETYIALVNQAFANGQVDHATLTRAEAVGDELDDTIEKIRNPVIAKAEAVAQQQTMLAWVTLAVTGAISLVIGAFSFLLARRVRGSISGELGELASTIARITQGHYNTSVPFDDRHDDIGQLARAAVNLRETSKAREEADHEMRELVNAMVSALDRLAQGDLTVTMPQVSPAFAKLRTDFNGAVKALHDAISSVSIAAAAIENGAREIDAASDDLSIRSEAQAADLSAASVKLGEVTVTVKDTANSATEAAGVVSTAVREAGEGGQTIREAVAAMGNIEKASDEISQIISVIDGITFQTNLLALNAGVEAARAGEAGKGFAVVASEVRALAQRSSDAASQIRSLIESSGREVSGGVQLVRRAGEAFTAIGQRIAQITALVERIRDGSENQSESLGTINVAVSGMDRTTQQNAAMVEQATAAAKSLATEARQLTDLVDRFGIENRASAYRPASAPSRRAAPAPAYSGNLALAHSDEGFNEF